MVTSIQIHYHVYLLEYTNFTYATVFTIVYGGLTSEYNWNYSRSRMETKEHLASS